MAEDKNSKVTQNQDRINKLIDELTLFDDDLMSRVFDKNIEATELLLRIILERKIKVISVNGQEEMKSAAVGGRNITLDVHALDENGEKMDIEVQGNSEGAHVRRARYHSSVLDSRMLKEGQEFKEIKDSYVIFIYKHDKFQKGLPLYHIDRYVRETNELFKDGSHIIYVNGNYKGDDEIGHLMQDFHQTDPDNMHYKELSQGVRHFKEAEEGRDTMCEAVQEYAKEYASECLKTEKAELVENFMKNMNLTLEQALDAAGIHGEEREAIIQLLQKQ
ncbi:Rpn family recombination-promoting nuclease/putative transposase [Simiaoa sunii]|uniref:PD-(D/E)XK nuclease family transposase n=1 Tax=Simiaoa sunii TaxID=2763672 RepID=A0A7G9FVB7_9FIRM|nr:Rpn family recombination-promoting nuclease/putative transposase [Simiaoa sunii]QNM02499.1 PD-(D/E)XK nuclease family transposase [Simiaoa sunii]